jgi:hypothetical protein
MTILAGAVLLAMSVGACSASDGRESSPAITANASPAASSAPRQLSVLQKRAGEDAIRSLLVEADGHWKCNDCDGRKSTTKGALPATVNSAVQALLADPALPAETDRARRYKRHCRDRGITTVTTEAGLISFADCAGEVRPRVAGAIADLLAANTPLGLPAEQVDA